MVRRREVGVDVDLEELCRYHGAVALYYSIAYHLGVLWGHGGGAAGLQHEVEAQREHRKLEQRGLHLRNAHRVEVKRKLVEEGAEVLTVSPVAPK